MTTYAVLGTLGPSEFPAEISSNAATATALAASRTINGTAFNGTANVTVPVNNADDTTTNATVYPLWTATAGGNYAAKVTSTKLTWNPSTAVLSVNGSQVLTQANTGAGNGLDADKLDGSHWTALRTDMLRNRATDSNFGWRDMVGDIVVRGSGSNDPTWTAFRSSLYAYQFSHTVMKEVWVSFHVQHDYAPGTPIYLHAHWSTAGTNAGVVRWGFEYTVAKGHQQQAFPTSTIVYVNQSAQGVAYYHMIAEVSLADTVPSTNLEPDSLILVRVFRDAADVADTCTDPSFLLTVDCHYQCDGISTKNKAPNFNT